MLNASGRATTHTGGLNIVDANTSQPLWRHAIQAQWRYRHRSAPDACRSANELILYINLGSYPQFVPPDLPGGDRRAKGRQRIV